VRSQRLRERIKHNQATTTSHTLRGIARVQQGGNHVSIRHARNSVGMKGSRSREAARQPIKEGEPQRNVANGSKLTPPIQFLRLSPAENFPRRSPPANSLCLAPAANSELLYELLVLHSLGTDRIENSPSIVALFAVTCLLCHC
jgi:hypothetical protein